jgi:hypothetical protein
MMVSCSTTSSTSLTYVFVPGCSCGVADRPADWIDGVVRVDAAASAYGFSARDAKDGRTTSSSPASRRTGTSSCSTCCSARDAEFNGVVLVVLAALVFVPLRYVIRRACRSCGRVDGRPGLAWAW